MSAERVVVVRPGEGHRVGNVEFLARSADTPRFNLAIITIQPHRHGPPAHVHFYLSGPGHPRQEAEELVFVGDPKISAEMAERSHRAGRFGGVRPLTRGADGAWQCTFDMRLRPN